MTPHSPPSSLIIGGSGLLGRALQKIIPTAYAPPRKDAIALVDKQRLSDLPTSPQNFKRALQINANFWADNADQINKRFQTWLTQ